MGSGIPPIEVPPVVGEPQRPSGRSAGKYRVRGGDVFKETLVDVYALSQRLATPPHAARGPDARGARQFCDDGFDWAHAETPGPAHENPFVSDHDDAVSV